VWNFEDFSTTNFLREINFGEFRFSKLPNLTVAEYQKLLIRV